MHLRFGKRLQKNSSTCVVHGPRTTIDNLENLVVSMLNSNLNLSSIGDKKKKKKTNQEMLRGTNQALNDQKIPGNTPACSRSVET